MSVWGYILAIFFIVVPSVATGVFLNWRKIQHRWWRFKSYGIPKILWRIKNSWAWFKGALVRIKRNFAIIGASALFVFFFIAFLLLFYFRLLPLIGLLYVAIGNQIEGIKIDSDAFRNISLSIGGSITLSIALLGVILTVIRNILTKQQNDTEEQRLVTEQISRGIDQIGAYKQSADGKILEPNMEVRMGGLYSLQRIMQDSERDEESIAKIFYAYVRENAKKGKIKTKEYQPREDVQAALDIISRFNKAWKKRGKGFSPDSRINLSRINFKGYSFTDINFRYAILEDVDLSDAILFKADLFGTDLFRANLSGANLTNSNLSNSYLTDSNLSNALISISNLTNSDLSGANLSGADLFDTNLSGSALKKANLSGANLSVVNFYNSDLSGANLSGALLYRASFLNANLEGANLEGANLMDANLSGANLKDAKCKGYNV